SDEDDVPGSVASLAQLAVDDLVGQMNAHIKTAQAGEIIRSGFRVVIAGAPNAGKSTLLNTLAKRDVAIVTDVAGTTRDVLEVSLDISGVKVVVSDTAGIRATSDYVEQLGIDRALAAIEKADLVLALSQLKPIDIQGKALHVKTKCDDGFMFGEGFDFHISCQTGFGLDALITAIGEYANQALGDLGESEIVFRARHLALLENGRAALLRFPASFKNGQEFAAEELRVASDSLAQITGAIGTEDVLGEIFSSFCIGK
ncbi:MAG: tRNA modification GTPase, partial [Notoacmeibacter sp.]